MSGATTATYIGLAGLALSAVGTIGNVMDAQQRKRADAEGVRRQQDAAKKAESQAASEAKAAEEAANRMYSRGAGGNAAIDAAAQAGKAGAAGTMLTGATGVAADQLQLGKKTLLGA